MRGILVVLNAPGLSQGSEIRNSISLVHALYDIKCFLGSEMWQLI